MRNRVKVALGAGALAVAAVAGGAGSYAFFTDTETVGPHSVATATLDLEAGTAAGSAPIGLTNVVPGAPSTTTTITMRNNGSIAGKLTLDVLPTGQFDAALGNAVHTVVYAPGHGIGGAPLNQVIAAQPRDFGTLAPGEAKDVRITVSLPATAGDEVQGKTAGFALQATLDQLP